MDNYKKDFKIAVIIFGLVCLLTIWGIDAQKTGIMQEKEKIVFQYQSGKSAEEIIQEIITEYNQSLE